MTIASEEDRLLDEVNASANDFTDLPWWDLLDHLSLALHLHALLCFDRGAQLIDIILNVREVLRLMVEPAIIAMEAV